MAISINWGTKVIYIPQADLTLLSGSLYELDVNQFRLDLKNLEDDPDGMGNPKTHTHNTTILLSGVTYARTVEVLPPYMVEFENGSYSVSCIGANHNIADRKVVNSVSLIINNSAGLIDINKEDIEHGAYNNEVTVDVVNGVSGTDHPTGTSRQPVSNMLDAMTIALARGFKTFRIVGNITITGAPSLDTFRLVGTNRAQSTITFSGADTGDIALENCKFSGSMSGALYARNCTVGTVTGIGCTTNDSVFDNCLLTGNITLRADNNRRINFVDTGTATHDLIDLDVNGTVGSISILGHRCRIRLKNVTSVAPAIAVHVTGVGMELRMAATCTAGTLEVHGDVNVVNEGHTMTVDDDTTHKLVWQSLIEGVYSAEELLRLIAAIAQGSATGLESGSPAFKSLDGTKTRVAATYAAGTRSITSRDAS